MNTHYLAIVASDRRVMSTIFKALHVDRAESGCPLPVLNGPASIAVFGTETCLNFLRLSSRTAEAVRENDAKITGVLPVPSDVPHVVVRRIRVDKHSPSEIRRRDARTEARRAEGRSSMTDADVEKRRQVWTDCGEVSRRPADLYVRSDSTRQQVPIWIQCEPSEPMSGSYTSYGFSSNGATVPAVL